MKMFRSKRELDNYVTDTLSKIVSEQEKVAKCFAFAKAYFGLREFETARRFLSDYLKSGASNLFAAHNLMGDTLVELNRHEEALDHYKKSYELGKTRDVLNKICSLIQNGYGLRETPQTRTNWLNLQRAATSVQFELPGSPASPSPNPGGVVHVATPRPKLFTSGSISLPENLSPKTSAPMSRGITGGGLFSVSNFASPSKVRMSTLKNGQSAGADNMGDNLTKLIESNKATVVHHTTLLQFYITDKKIRDAAAHVHKYMLKYGSNFEFLEKSTQVMEEALQEYLDPSKFVTGAKLSEAEFFSAYFFILENYVGLLLDKNLKDVIPEAVGEKRIDLAASFLKKLDQQLFLRGRKVKFSPLESWWPPFLKHCKAQLTFYIGILLQLRSQRDGKHKDLFQPCFTLASNFVIDQPLTMIKLRDPRLQQRAFIECCYRVLLIHTLVSSNKGGTTTTTFTSELKDLIYDRCFTSKDPMSGSKVTSEFFSIQAESKLKSTGPLSGGSLSDEKFWLYLRVSQLLYPSSLHHQVWLQSQALAKHNNNAALNLEPPLLHSVGFEEIPASAPSERMDADSISQVDVDTFLTLSTVILNMEDPSFSARLPHLSYDVLSPDQLKWWSSAYKLTHGIHTNGSTEWAATEQRLQVQRGLEMIRNTENTLPPSLLNVAGAAFTRAAQALEETNTARQFLHLSIPLSDLHQIYFDAAELYYRQFIESFLEPHPSDKRNKSGFIRFFDVRHFPDIPNLPMALERARFLLGWKAMERRDFESALTHFTETSFPESSLFSAEMYKLLAEEELELSNNADSGIKHKALLEQAKELLYETLNRKDKKPQDYLLGKSNVDSVRAPLPHPKLENEAELLDMIDEVEGRLRDVALNISFSNLSQLNASFHPHSPGLNGSGGGNNHENGGSVYPKLDELQVVDLSQEHSHSQDTTDGLPEFTIRTPIIKGRRSLGLREQLLISSSTPKRLDETMEDVNMEDELTLQAALAFGDSLEKILEQNSVILDTISQMEDEIKDLNDRVEMLKKSKRFSRKNNNINNRVVSFFK